MKRTITGLVAGALIAVTGGMVYAFFTSDAVADDSVVTAADPDLQLSADGGAWANTVAGPWQLAGMSPGVEEEYGKLEMRNIGSTDLNYIKIAMSGYIETEVGMIDKLRITKLDYNDSPVLYGGAGADFRNYPLPSGCDTLATTDLQVKIGVAVAGDVICVNTSTIVGNIDVNKDVDVVALFAPNSAQKVTIDGLVDVTADGATFKGFYVAPSLPVAAKEAGITVSASNVTIDSNIVHGMSSNAGESIKGVYVYNGTVGDLTGITVSNNLIENMSNSAKGSYGVMVQGFLNGVTVTHNTIKNIQSAGWGGSGIEVTPTGVATANSPKSVVITSNHIENIGSGSEPGKGISLDWYNGSAGTHITNASDVTVNMNNFIGTPLDIRVIDPNPAHTLNATSNWWGDFTPAVLTFGAVVDTSGYAGGAFLGFIGGTDGSNVNGFADLGDLEELGIKNLTPGVLANQGSIGKFEMSVQLDGPTTGDIFQGDSVTFDLTVSASQVEA